MYNGLLELELGNRSSRIEFVSNLNGLRISRIEGLEPNPFVKRVEKP